MNGRMKSYRHTGKLNVKETPQIYEDNKRNKRGRG